MARDSQIIPNINRLLHVFPYYGNFSIIECALERVADSAGNIIQEKYTPDVNDMVGINIYLCGYGFAERRYDIDKSGNQIQLTDRGRKLKESGSIKKFRQWYRKEQSEAVFRTKMVEYNYWVAVCIGLSTFVAAVYYYFQLLDGTPPHKCAAKYTLGICIAAAAILITLRYLPRFLKKS